MLSLDAVMDVVDVVVRAAFAGARATMVDRVRADRMVAQARWKCVMQRMYAEKFPASKINGHLTNNRLSAHF